MNVPVLGYNNRTAVILRCAIIYVSMKKGGLLMNQSKNNCASANHCIACTVQQCANHCGGENYCSLDRITVGTHEYNPTEDQCTDCKSFRKK